MGLGFFVMFIIAAIFLTGVFMLAPATMRQTWRMSAARRFNTTSLRKGLMEVIIAANLKATGFKTEKRNEQIRKEIYNALSVLRNYASADAEGMSITTDHLLEQFSQTDGILKEIYSGALKLLRTGRCAETAEYFAAAAGIDLSKDFILLILGWDSIPPYKLRKAIDAFQNALKETRTTELVRKNEAMSDLVYLPVVAGVLVIFVNFIYVAYFAEQRALLSELFF